MKNVKRQPAADHDVVEKLAHGEEVLCPRSGCDKLLCLVRAPGETTDQVLFQAAMCPEHGIVSPLMPEGLRSGSAHGGG